MDELVVRMKWRVPVLVIVVSEIDVDFKQSGATLTAVFIDFITGDDVDSFHKAIVKTIEVVEHLGRSAGGPQRALAGVAAPAKQQ